jgi:hypothetical protein
MAVRLPLFVTMVKPPGPTVAAKMAVAEYVLATAKTSTLFVIETPLAPPCELAKIPVAWPALAVRSPLLMIERGEPE